MIAESVCVFYCRINDLEQNGMAIINMYHLSGYKLAKKGILEQNPLAKRVDLDEDRLVIYLDEVWSHTDNRAHCQHNHVPTSGASLCRRWVVRIRDAVYSKKSLKALFLSV